MMKRFIFLALLFSLTQSIAAVELDMENQNLALSELAEMFYDDQDEPIYQQDFLQATQLDFSLRSLKHVDDYLHIVRPDFANLDQAQQFGVVLRAGVYVGEVIRRNDQKTQWYWVDYDTAVALNPELFANFPRSIELAAVLTDGNLFTFPLNKIMKYMQNGAEDSVAFYAEATVAQPAQ